MLTLALTIPTWAVGLGVALFVLISAMLILVILVQKPQGGGLSEAFGASGGGAGATAFGAKTGDALTTATIGMFVVFILVAVGLNYTVRPPEAIDEATISADPAAPVVPGSTGSVPGATTTTSTSTEPMGSVQVLPAEPAPAATTPAPAPAPTGETPAQPTPAPSGEAPAEPTPGSQEQPKQPQ